MKWRLGDPGRPLLVDAVKVQFPAFENIWADQGHTGEFRRWASRELNVDLEVVYPWWRQLKRYAPDILEAQGFDLDAFHVLPDVRLWSGHSPGWAETVGCPKTSRPSLEPPKRGVISP